MEAQSMGYFRKQCTVVLNNIATATITEIKPLGI
jgi:hypothetical protein